MSFGTYEMLLIGNYFLFTFDLSTVDKCNGLFVKGANYADCAGTYFLLYKKVYKRKTGLDHNRYIFLMGNKWVIGTKENLARRNGFFYESSKYDIDPLNHLFCSLSFRKTILKTLKNNSEIYSNDNRINR